MIATKLLVFLRETIRNRHAVCIQSAPGLGKSDIVAQAAREVGADLILSHPAVEDPTDTKGFPLLTKNGEMQFAPAPDLLRAMKAEKPTVWFFDDLGQASPAVQAAKMQLLLAREVAGHRVSDFITFIAATNRRIDRAGVSGILEPVKSRFVSIVELTADLDAYCAWAIDNNINPMLIAFHRFKGGSLLSDFKPTNDLTNSPSPRTWSHVNKLMQLDLPADIMQEAIAGAVGEGAAVEFGAFEKSWRLLPNIDQILIDPSKSDIPTNPAVLYSLASALAMKANPTTFAPIASYVQRLVKAGSAEFGVLCVRDCLRKDPSITQSQAFVKLATSELGKLISGKD